MSDRLPLNAQAFFSDKKPDTYVYHAMDAPNRTPEGKNVEIIGTIKKSVHKMRVNVQPRIIGGPTVPLPIKESPRSTVIQQKQIQQPLLKAQAPKQAHSIKSTLEVASKSIRSKVIPATKPKPVYCKYIKRTGGKAGCGCGASLTCENPECPLSKVLQSGKKTTLQSSKCRPDSCQWYAPNQ